MTTLIAKPIIQDQYWVITDGERKVGNVIANGTGFQVKLHGVNSQYKSTTDIKRTKQIKFETLKTNRIKIVFPLPEYPTTPRKYNSMLDIKRQLHLYTKTPKSKCYYAAGWFVIDQNGTTEVIFCPKYIFVQRYAYLGPFKTQEQAKSMINNL